MHTQAWCRCRGVERSAPHPPALPQNSLSSASFLSQANMPSSPPPHPTPTPHPHTCRQFFQMKLEPPQSEWRPVKMTVKVNSTTDLWRVCLKSKWATIEIPELEFEISADGKRRTDSIYNHIASAVYNLGNYVSRTHCGTSSLLWWSLYAIEVIIAV